MVKIVAILLFISMLFFIAVMYVIDAKGDDVNRIEKTTRINTEKPEHIYPVKEHKENRPVKPSKKGGKVTVTPRRQICTTNFYYTAEELWLMAHLISGEAGCDWCSDLHQLYVGSVVLNRVNSDIYPNSIREVIYQPGQYTCTTDGNFYVEPTERCFENARWILINGSILPENVIFQSQGIQGDGVYVKEQNQYFCYLGEEPRGDEE